MQGAEMEDEGSVLKYMTKSEIEEQRSSLLIMTQRRTCQVGNPQENCFIRTSEHQKLQNIYFCTPQGIRFICEITLNKLGNDIAVDPSVL